jgi:HAD superfamily hydrolase (TIGR01509 family)
MLLIFDCDGVLVDSELVALETLSTVMTEYGHPMSVAACRDAFMGQHNDDIVRGIEQRIGRELPGEGSRLRARMLTRLEQELKPVSGVADALSRLAGPMCVASSSDSARIRLTLQWTALDRFFGDAIFSGMDVARGKPAPDIFLHAASKMGFPPSDCLVVEDSTMGVRAGVAAGMTVIGFTGGSHTDAHHAARLREAGAAMTIADMTELPALVKNLGSGKA